MFDRITFETGVLGGRACMRGMRIPVAVIVSQVSHGASVDELLREDPRLETDDISQAVKYAAWLAQEEARARPTQDLW